MVVFMYGSLVCRADCVDAVLRALDSSTIYKPLSETGIYMDTSDFSSCFRINH